MREPKNNVVTLPIHERLVLHIAYSSSTESNVIGLHSYDDENGDLAAHLCTVSTLLYGDAERGGAIYTVDAASFDKLFSTEYASNIESDDDEAMRKFTRVVYVQAERAIIVIEQASAL